MSSQKTPRCVCCFVLASFFLNSFSFSSAFASVDSALTLPAPGAMVAASAAFNPVLLKGITVHPQNPYQFDFLFTSGDKRLQGIVLQEEAEKLIKYFLASLTVPEKDLWVNLSPYEKDRIIPKELGQTDLGRDLLTQDYILKELASSLTHPEKELGKSFWSQVYKKAYEKYGRTDMPVSTFNKVWVLADTAKVYEHQNKAFVLEGQLKVLSEEDFLGVKKFKVRSAELMSDLKGKEASAQMKADAEGLSVQVFRRVVIPEIEKEVNKGKHFAQLRQIYYSVILATWFKKKLKESLVGRVYADKNKVQGIDVSMDFKQEIYQQYLRAYKKGFYNYIKEEADPQTHQTVARKYFSGGLTPAVTATGMSLDQAMQIETGPEFARDLQQVLSQDAFYVSGQLNLSAEKSDAALVANLSNYKDFPTPWPFPNVLTGRGSDTPEWLESYVLARLVRRLTNNGRTSVALDKIIAESAEALNEFFVNSYGSRMREIDKRNLIDGLRSRGLISYRQERKTGNFQVSLRQDPRLIAVWSNDTEYIREDLKAALNMGRKRLLRTMDTYAKVTELWLQFPKEAMDPVLRAVSLMTPAEKKRVAAFLYRRLEIARSPLIDHILLMLSNGSAKKDWLKKHASNLIGRTVYSTTPEYRNLKGGLGRVEKYHGEDLEELGADLAYIEPRFRWVREQGEVKEVDPQNSPIQIRDERRLDKTFSTFLARKGQDGKYYTQKVDFEAWVGTNEKGIPVFSFQDIAAPGEEILSIVYESNRSKDARTKATEDEVNIFMAKATVELIRYLELEKKKREGQQYRAPVIDANDGQMLTVNAWITMFYRSDPSKILRDENTSEEDIQLAHEIFRDALLAGTTHTYRNRWVNYNFGDALDMLRANGVPDEWLWLFVRRELNHGRFEYVIDGTSAGLRSSDAPKAVSAIHAYDMNARDPGIFLTGITNGDLPEYTGFYFQEILKDMGVADVHNITAAIGALAKAKQILRLDPLKMVVSYSGRGVDEKLDISDDLIRSLVQSGIQVYIAANEQASDESRLLIARLRGLKQRLEDEGYRDDGEHADKGRLILEVGFNIDRQRQILAASDIQFQASTRHTEAAGSTEANGSATFTLQASQTFWEGYLNKIGDAVNLKKRTGNVLVPSGRSNQAVLEMFQAYNEEFHAWGWEDFLEGKDPDKVRHGLPEFQLYGYGISPVTSSVHTAAAYLRFWNKALDKERPAYVRPKPLGEITSKEISLEFLDQNGASVERTGERFRLVNADNKPFILKAIVRPDAIRLDTGEAIKFDEDLLKSSLQIDLISDFGHRYRLKPTSQWRQLREGGEFYEMAVELTPDALSSFSGQVEFTIGLWKEQERVIISMADSASIAEDRTAENPGGILLDPANLKMQVDSNGNSSALNSSLPVDFNEQNFSGFYWKTLNIAPVYSSSLPKLLGLSPTHHQEAQDNQPLALHRTAR